MQCCAIYKGNHFVQNSEITSDFQIMRRRIRQPEAIIRNSRTDSLPGWWKPPVLNVALFELPRRGAQQMLPRQLGFRDGERHLILRLIAEPIGTARLIKRRSRPEAARFESGLSPASAAGCSKVPLRPINSVRSAVQLNSCPARCANATRSPKSPLHELRARTDFVAGSISVTTKGAVAPREVPS